MEFSIVDRALYLALRYHNGQVNKHDNEPYTLHLQRVAYRMRRYGDVHIAVAWLHDILEDTECTLETLANEFPADPTIPAAVEAITKRNGETLVEYYTRVKLNDIARIVKRDGDAEDNFSRNYLIKNDETRSRLAAKYSLCKDMLK